MRVLSSIETSFAEFSAKWIWILTGVVTVAWLASAPGPFAGVGVVLGASCAVNLKIDPTGRTTTPETIVTATLKSRVPLWIWNPVKLSEGAPVASHGARNQTLPFPRLKCLWGPGGTMIPAFTGNTPKIFAALP